MIFVGSDIFFVFYLKYLIKGDSQMTKTILEKIAVIKLCLSIIQTLTTKTIKTDQQTVWLAAHNLTTQFLLIDF